ncbi:glycosyltransferase [Paludibaculum fermentans]|uniref:glycosyltransferase n=1 Tax=Paludibaculum fermentans TaxID=1473598 RepID=UPI003EBC0C6F
MNRRHILLISYLFPPAGGVGVQRALAYARYLPECGCRVTVLSAANPSTPVLDPSLASRIPREVRVVRTFTPEVPYRWRDAIWKRLSRGKRPGTQATAPPQAAAKPAGRGLLGRLVDLLATPDPQKVWAPWALRRATRLIRDSDIGTVLINVPPFSSLAVAAELRRRFPDLLILCDYRDEFLSYYLPRLDEVGSAARYQQGAELERGAVHAANFVSTVTEPWRQAIRNRHPDQPDSKFLCVPNGYDPAAFAGFQSRPSGGEALRIVYVGTVYTNPVYSPKVFLDAVEGLPAAERDRLRLRFVGRIARDAEPWFEGRPFQMERCGFLPQVEAFKKLEDADCLLLIVGDENAHSGKLFEYLATGKPILALAPKGSQVRQLMEQTRAGWCADAGSTEEIQALLRLMLERKQQNQGLVERDEELIRSYERPRQVRRLLELAGIVEKA